MSRLTAHLKANMVKEQEQLGALVSARSQSLPSLEPPSSHTIEDVFATPTKSKKQKDTISQALRLSVPASFLLIAAYLASYNHSRTDVRMFATREEEGLHSSPSKRRRGSPRKQSAVQRVVRLAV